MAPCPTAEGPPSEHLERLQVWKQVTILMCLSSPNVLGCGRKCITGTTKSKQAGLYRSLQHHLPAEHCTVWCKTLHKHQASSDKLHDYALQTQILNTKV